MSCASKQEKPLADDAQIDLTGTDSFFPVTSYLKGQMIILDSLPVTPLQITTIKGGKDSVWLSKENLRQVLQPFLTPQISETNLTRYFKETRFNDQTINAITFIYEPINKLPDSIPLRRWTVYVDPEKGMVSKIYMVQQLKQGDQIITRQLTWQTNKLAKISSILDRPDGSMELLKEEEFIWNFQ
jgi:hypothetical protein